MSRSRSKPSNTWRIPARSRASWYELPDRAAGSLSTTPNQRSLVSLGSLLLKGHFSAFGPGNYPAHQTALLDTDLLRIARENHLCDIAIEFTRVGRMPFTGARYPRALSRAFPRAMSDHVLLVARTRS